MNPLKLLLKGILISWFGVGPYSAFLIKLPVMLLLQVQEPHLEGQGCGRPDTLPRSGQPPSLLALGTWLVSHLLRTEGWVFGLSPSDFHPGVICPGSGQGRGVW